MGYLLVWATACRCGLSLVSVGYYFVDVGYCSSVWSIAYQCGLLLVDVGYCLSMWAIACQCGLLLCRCGLLLVSVVYRLSVWATTCRCGLLLVGVGYCSSVWDIVCRCGLSVGVGYCSSVWAIAHLIGIYGLLRLQPPWTRSILGCIEDFVFRCNPQPLQGPSTETFLAHGPDLLGAVNRVRSQSALGLDAVGSSSRGNGGFCGVGALPNTPLAVNPMYVYQVMYFHFFSLLILFHNVRSDLIH